ncbi:MAG: hypothetical protein ACXABY_34330, partial [Candidatus Thorarchaeota archaeon]
YAPTDKEPGEYFNETIYWSFAGRVSDSLGPDGGTLQEIYLGVTRPMGLSLQDTRELLSRGRARGYFR